MPQLIALARNQITDVLKEELHRRDQIKSAIVIKATYVRYKYTGGDVTNINNYEKTYYHSYHGGSNTYFSQKMI